MKIYTITCAKCKVPWQPKVLAPKKCPNCQTRYWRAGKKSEAA